MCALDLRGSTDDRIPGRGMLNAMTTTADKLTYSVPGISCGHCRAAIASEIEKLVGIEAVDVDLDSKRVTVTGSALDDEALRAAIDEAGYDVE